MSTSHLVVKTKNSYKVYYHDNFIKKFESLEEACRYIRRQNINQFLLSPVTNPLWYVPLSVYRVLLSTTHFPLLDDAKRWVVENGVFDMEERDDDRFEIQILNIHHPPLFWSICLLEKKTWLEYLLGMESYHYYRYFYDKQLSVYLDVRFPR
jgi:hypothetical protein